MRMLCPLSPCPKARKARPLTVHTSFVNSQVVVALLPKGLLSKQWTCSFLDSFSFVKTISFARLHFRKEKTQIAASTCKQHQYFKDSRRLLEHSTHS